MEVSALKHPGLALRGPTPLLRLQCDERLVALTRRGNQAAFEALVARYETRLLAFCRHMLGSREDAEDVLQEVFAASFHAMVADERAIHVRPWLYRIARNRSLNHLRRHQAIGVDSMDVHLAEHGTTTADKVHRREEFRELVDDLHGLPETQRTALLLREIDALSYEQLAEAMETTVPSVKSLLVRARVSLAEAAEARQLSCGEARVELGEVAEGLRRSSPPVRRHLRTCERCSAFRKQLRENNRALAAVLPVGPLLLLKKFALAHLSTSGAAGGASAGAAAGGAAVGGASVGGGVSAGVIAVAGKTAAGLAAAALVTAGAVEADHAASPGSARHSSAVATRVAQASAPPLPVVATPPVAVAARPEPVTTRAAAKKPKPPKAKPPIAKAATTTTTTPTTTAATTTPTTATVAHDAATTTVPTVTQEEGDTTVLPPQDTTAAPSSPPPSTPPPATAPSDQPPPPAADGGQPAPQPTPADQQADPGSEGSAPPPTQSLPVVVTGP